MNVEWVSANTDTKPTITAAALERLIVAELQRFELVSAGRERAGLRKAIAVVHQVCATVRKETGR